MSAPDLEALADRVEKLDGPSREVDAEILCAICPGATVGEYIVGDGNDVVFHARSLGLPDKSICPAFTASIDAAMTLVPDNCLFTVRTLWDGDRVAGFASISRYELGGPKDQLRRYWMDEAQANAATPALALCAAALRAHPGDHNHDQ